MRRRLQRQDSNAATPRAGTASAVVEAGWNVGPAPRPPKWSTGQMRRIALARMFLRGTRPKTRESLEKLRLSPITKYWSDGMVIFCGVGDASPLAWQQSLSVVQ